MTQFYVFVVGISMSDDI